MDLKGKLALVTGSTSGIGLSIAHTLAKAGSDVIITGLGDDKTITDIVETIKSKYKVNAEYIGADLSNTEETKSLVSQLLQRHPEGVDILINNAGIGPCAKLEEFPDEVWDKMVAIMLTAPFLLIKLLLPTMKKKGWGRIVNTASATAKIAFKLLTPYGVMKHGLSGLTKGVALEVGEYGITCNTVCPALVKTAMTDHSVEVMAKINNITPDEQRVAELVLFIVASGASEQMTGADYLIDSGYTAA